MAELLVKIGDNAPWKDRIFDLKTTESGAMESLREFFLSEWEERLSGLSLDQRVAAVNTWLADNAMGHWKHGDVIKARPDGFDWGSRESYPRNHIVYVPDAQLAAMGVSWNLPGSGEWKGPGDQRRIIELEQPLARAVQPLNFNRRRFGIDPTILGDRERIATSASNLVEKTQFVPFNADTAFEHHSGGTFLIRASGGHYTDLSDWDANEAYDCDSGGQSSIAECYDDWPGGLDDTVDLNTDWVSSASYMPKITAADGHRHDGTAESGFFLNYTGSSLYPLAVRTTYSEWTYLELQLSGQASTSAAFLIGVSSPYWTLEKCILHRTGGYGGGMLLDNGTYKDCLIYALSDGSHGGAHIYKGTLVNCTLFSPGPGDSGGWGCYGTENFNALVRSALCKNVVAWNGNSSHDTYGTFISCTGDYNCGDDASAPGANSLDNKALADLAWVSTAFGSEDFSHAQASVLVVAGVGPAVDPGVPILSINGETRSGSITDIGAFLFAAGGTTYHGLVADGISMEDSPGCAMRMSALAVEGVSASDNGSPTTRFIAALSDSSSLSDNITPSVRMIACIMENASVDDGTASVARFPTIISESLSVADMQAAIAIMAAYGQSSAILFDEASWFNAIRGIIQEGVSVSDAVLSAMRSIAAIVESFSVKDGTTVRATFSVKAQSASSFHSTVGSVVAFLALVYDTVSPADSAKWPSSATGRVSVSFSGQTATITLTGEKAVIVVTVE